MICAQQLPQYFAFASRLIDENFVQGPSTKCLANLGHDGQIRAVVIYDRTNDFDCMMHITSDESGHWLTRLFLRAAFHVPFMQWGLCRVTGLVREDNRRALAFDKRLGFIEEGRIRKAFGDCDGILLGMLKEECRFLKGM